MVDRTRLKLYWKKNYSILQYLRGLLIDLISHTKEHLFLSHWFCKDLYIMPKYVLFVPFHSLSIVSQHFQCRAVWYDLLFLMRSACQNQYSPFSSCPFKSDSIFRVDNDYFIDVWMSALRQEIVCFR
jgi:hypothetical protein